VLAELGELLVHVAPQVVEALVGIVDPPRQLLGHVATIWRKAPDRYGRARDRGLRAPVLRGVSLRVSRGEIVTLIGSNGAGKSTTLRTISGLLPVRKGRVRFLDRTVSALPPHALVHVVTRAPGGAERLEVRSVTERFGGLVAP